MKKKLRLTMDALEVETFEAAGESGARGTVFARETYAPECETEEMYCTTSDTVWEQCTNDPWNLNCYSYAVQCPLTSGWTCCGSGCTEGHTCQHWC